MTGKTGYSLKKRFLLFAACLGAGAIALLIRYAWIILRQEEPGIGIRTEMVSGRGPILDRNGEILAMETRLGNVTLWKPSMNTDVSAAQLSRELSPILEIPAGELEAAILNSASNFLYLKKSVDDATIKLIEDAKKEIVNKKNRLMGVEIEPMLNRVYPEGSLAAQIIGFTNVKITDSEEQTGHIKSSSRDGIAGIENAFNEELSPKPLPSLPGTRNYQSGDSVYLTLDINVQMILENIAAKTLSENRAEAVMFMAMDPRNGDILGSVSLPGFDPNNLNNPSEIALMDRPAIWSYEPGSVFKVFSLSALMDEGAISENTVFTCNGFYERITSTGQREIINCLGAHGRVTARDIIIHSCNAGAAYAADRMGSSLFNDILRDFGFGSRTSAGNPGETMGYFRDVNHWTNRSKPTIAMGQEIGVSALQMIQAASAVANDGILVPPRIVSRIVSADGKVTEYAPNKPRQVLKAETARAMRSYMMDVTSDIGTGWRANVEDLSLAVKTGTSQVINPATGKYSDTDYIASCMAFLPAESPSLILYLVIVKPQGDSYLGGRIAAPPIREAAEELINYLGIPRGRNPQISHSGAISLPPITYPLVTDSVPDFTGYSNRQLLPLLLQDGLKFRITGNGWVVRQNPAPGAPVSPDMVIELELE